jgi:hypothetical protein
MVVLNLTLILITYTSYRTYSLSYFNWLFRVSFKQTGLQSMLEISLGSLLVKAASTYLSRSNRLPIVLDGLMLMARRIPLRGKKGIKRWGKWKCKAEGKIAKMEEKGRWEDVWVYELRWEGYRRMMEGENVKWKGRQLYNMQLFLHTYRKKDQ